MKSAVKEERTTKRSSEARGYHRHIPAPRGTTFTEEEILELEDSFVEAYLRGGEGDPIRLLFSIYRRFWPQFLLSFFFYILKHSPVLVLPVVTSNIINAVIYTSGQELVWQIAINAGIEALLVILNVPFHTLHARYHSLVVRRVEAGLRGAMVRKLQQLSITFHREMQSGRIQSKLMRDVETVQALSDQLFSQIPGLVVNIVTAVTVVAVSSPAMLLFFLICIPCAILLLRVFRGKITQSNRDYRRKMESTSASLMDMVEMTEITRAHALEEREVRKMTSRLQGVANSGHRLDLVQAIFGSCHWALFSLFQLVCLVFSSLMAANGLILVGNISMYQTYFNSLTGQISAIIAMVPTMTKGFESLRSIGEILANRDTEENENKRRLPALRGEYEFRDIFFHYKEEQPLLRGLNLHVRAGETIALVGESGSGKTTLLNLLIGFHTPVSGQLMIDGQDSTTLDMRSYRSHIAVVPQSSVFFTGSIRENITYGVENVSDAQLLAALDAACLTKFISTLPHGVDTMLEEHGANLSGGQRQRLSIARAIIRRPDVIILDEATSALDTISEKEIQTAISNMAREHTTFIVAHRLSTIRNADRIAVIENGVCAEIGSFEELMERKGAFWRMQTAQASV